MPDPRTLPEDIYGLLDTDNDHEVSEENVEWAGEAFKDLLRRRLKKREDSDGLRFSNLGKPDRQIWYAVNKPEAAEKLSGKNQLKFMYGDVIEVLLLFLAKEAGHDVTHEQHQVDADGVKGHMDCCIDGIPSDVKSASPFSFAKFESGSFVFNDPFGYIKQLSGYANAIGRTDRAGFFVANKVDGSLCYAEIDEYTVRGNPPEPRVAALRSIIKSPEPPARCFDDRPDGKSGNRALGVNCSYCAFKQECWKDSNDGQGLRTFFYSSGPKFLTKVVKEPKVGEGN